MFRVAFVSIQYYKKHNIIDCLFIDCLFIGLPVYCALFVIAEEQADESDDDEQITEAKDFHLCCYVEVVYLGKPTDPDHFLFRMTNTIEDVKARIQKEKNIDKEQQKIIFKQKGSDVAGMVPDDNMKLRDVLDMAGEPQSFRIQLKLDMIGGGKYI